MFLTFSGWFPFAIQSRCFKLILGSEVSLGNRFDWWVPSLHSLIIYIWVLMIHFKLCLYLKHAEMIKIRS